MTLAAPPVIAVLCSDIHLSHNMPSARAGDWYAAMENGLRQLGDLAEEYDVPIICAGDIFDRWNSCPELTNFALDCLPKMYAVPGQHDMPNHNYDEIHRSAFRTLCKAGRITEIKDWVPVNSRLTVFGFRWGTGIVPSKARGAGVNLAVVHSYVWEGAYGYPGAPETKRAGAYRAALAGYDAAVFGDNHKGFLYHWPHGRGGDFHLWNNGTFFARHSDEREYRPRVGLLFADGVIAPHYLDTSKDEWSDAGIPASETGPGGFDARKFLEGLDQLGLDSLDYRLAVGRALDAVGAGPEVRRRVNAALETRE